MGIELCQIRRQDSGNSRYWLRHLFQGICGPGERLTKLQATARPDFLWPAREARTGLSRSQKVDNARKLRGIYFMDPEDEEYKETLKYARKKLDTLLEAAIPWKMETRKRFSEQRETVASGDTHAHKKTMYALYCGSSRIYKEAFVVYSSREIMTTTSQRKDSILWLITIWCINLFNVPSDENSGCEGCSEKRMREAREDPCVADGWSEKQKGCYSWSTKREKGKTPLLHWWTFVISRMPS